MPVSEKVLVLMSGGMYSAVAAAAVDEEVSRYFLFVDFQQRAEPRERAAYEALCQHFQPKRHWRAQLNHFKQVGGSALVDPDQAIEDAASLPVGTASTYVAGLLPTLLDVAASFAFRIRAARIIAGFSEERRQPGPGIRVMHPDHSREFLQNYQYMLDSALPADTRVRVEAPLMDFSRAEVVQLGRRLGVPLDATWSCYLAGDAPCGRCFGCAHRASGFIEAASPDPLILPGEQVKQ